MAVVSVARFKVNPARVKEMFGNAKKTKEVFLANGAERVFWGSVLSGTGSTGGAYRPKPYYVDGLVDR